MDSEQENNDILKMMVDNETAISEIYRIYAQQYKKHQKFWNDLAREEIQHARLIEKLSKRVEMFLFQK
jgi:rubrerythrin